MFIEQINTKKFNPILYIPIPLFFLALIILNYFMSKGVDTNAVMHELIDKVGLNIAFILAVIPLSIACLILLFWVVFIHQQSITSLTTSRSRVDWKRIFFSFGLWSAISIFSFIISYLISPENFIFNFKPVPFFIFFLLAIILLPLQTSFEEYLFRGYVMQGLGVITKSKLIPFLTTSILFGIMHIANPEVEKLGYIVLIYYVSTGFLLGIMTLMDDGLELSLGFHAANNLVGALLVTSDWGALQTNSILKDISQPSAGIEIVLPVLIVYPILLFIFSKKYCWTNWKEKLTGTIVETNISEINKIGINE